MHESESAGEVEARSTSAAVRRMAAQRGNGLKRESEFELLARIQPELMAIHMRLENWAKWSRDRIRQGHCRSIEHRYKSTDVHQDERGPRLAWDALDAEDLHRCVCEIPERQRWLLHLHYLHLSPAGYIRRALGIRRDEMADELNRARRMVENRTRVCYKSSTI